MHERPAMPRSAALLLTVTLVADPQDRSQDETFEFADEGSRRTFGRSDDADIVVWPALNDPRLSRLAGVIWRAEDALWLRNLSRRHELVVASRGYEQRLRPRGPINVRGDALALPAPVATVIGPADCVLHVRQEGVTAAELDPGLRPSGTPTLQSVPDVPETHRLLATALCEPLLLGNRLPASYQEVMARLHRHSLRVLRKDVETLVEFYRPALHSTERTPSQDTEVLPAGQPGLVVRWDGPRPVDVSIPRSRSLTLPEYAEVAMLLVRHGRITNGDLRLLDGPSEHPR